MNLSICENKNNKNCVNKTLRTFSWSFQLYHIRKKYSNYSFIQVYNKVVMKFLAIYFPCGFM